MRKKPSIQVGDRFVKIGAFQTFTWVVGRIFQLPSEPAHALLCREDNQRELITISLSTLADPHFYRRAS